MRTASTQALALFVLVTLSPAIVAAQSASAGKSDLGSHLQRAQAALQRNQPEIAKQELQAALALDPKNADAHTNLGVIEFFQGDCNAAANDLRAALAVRPALAKAQALLGICDSRLGKRSAQAELEFAFSKLKDAKLRTQVGIELVGIYDRSGNLDRATSVLKTLVDMNPENPDVLYMAQRLYTELADDTLNKLAIVAPDSARMQQVIAERLVNAGDLPNAIIHYEKALEIDPHIPGARFELAEAFLESSPSNPQSQASAVKELEAEIKAGGDNAKSECLFARIALLQSDPDQAFARYTRALALDPAESEAQLGLGGVLLEKDKPEEALKYLRTAVQSDPLNSEAHYRLATAYRRLHRTEDSAREMKLFQEIKQTKDQVKELYRQMNKRSPAQPGAAPDEDTVKAPQ